MKPDIFTGMIPAFVQSSSSTGTTRKRFPPVLFTLPVVLAFLSLLLVKTPSFCDALGSDEQYQSNYEKSTYELAFEEMYEDEVDKLAANINIPGVGNIFDYLEAILDIDIPGVGNYMVIFEDDGLLNGMKSFSVAKSFFGLSRFWNGQFGPVPKCSDQSFGLEGQWTDAICNTTEKLIAICDSQESNCDPLAFQNIVAAKGEIVATSTLRATTLFCLYVNGFNDSHCSPDEIKDCVDDQSKCTQIGLSYYNQVQELSRLLKATATNLLTTNIMGDTALYHSDVYDGAPVADISDPNSNFL